MSENDRSSGTTDDREVEGPTDDPTMEEVTAEEPDLEEATVDGGRLSRLTDVDSPVSTRRGVLGALGVGSLLALGSSGAGASEVSDASGGIESASTLQDGTTLTFGDTFTGDPGSQDSALKLVNNGTDTFEFGLRAEAPNSPRGRGIGGFAGINSNDLSVALFGRNLSSEGIAIQGVADSGSGSTQGVNARVESGEGRGMYALNNGSEGDAYGAYCQTNSKDGIAVYGFADNGSGSTYGVYGETNSSDGLGIYTPDDAQVDGDMTIGGDVVVQGTKDFAQRIETPSGSATVRYTAIEAGQAKTEVSDVADLEDGRVEIELPEHFQMVTSEEKDLAVQLTPYAKEQAHPQVVERSLERIVVEDFGDGSDEYALAYTVKGVRDGFEDQQVVHD